MVASITLGRVQNLNSIVVAYGRNPELIRNLPQGTHIINALRTRLLARSKRAAEEHPSVDEDGRETIAYKTAEMEDTQSGYFDRISDLIAKFEKRKRGWKPSKGYEAQPKVDHQIAAISKLIRQGNKTRAGEFLYDLVGFHLEHSEKEHVAMSLCALAKTAIDAQALEVAVELVGYAVMLDIEDPVIGNTHAEVLRAMGHLDQALAMYEETMNRFPDYVVTRNGYAEVLKGMGRFEQALTIYEETMNRFPDDVVARTGYAEVLKGMGRFEQALTIYEETMNRFPDDVVARSGLASLFMFMDRFEEVRSLLSEKSPISRSDWINCHILAMTCLKLGDLDEAITRLEYGWKNARWIDVKNYFATGLGVARIRKREFAEAVEVLADNVVSLDTFQKQKRLVLIGHSQAELGREADAMDSLAQVVNTDNPHVVNLKEALIQRYGLRQETVRSLSEREVADLERKIHDEEFVLAVAA